MIDDQEAHHLLVKLKRAVAQNDADAVSLFLEQLYVHFSAPFCSFAQSRGLSFEDAEEVVNDTFARICRSINTYKENGKGRSWIWQICRNRIKDELKKRQKEKKNGISFHLIGNFADDVFSSGRWSPDRIHETNELWENFKKAWKSLSREEQEEILKREHTPGTKGQAWEAAWQRFCTIFKASYKNIQ